MLFITTSRKPSQLTRKLCRWMGRFLGDYDNRGKSSLDALAERAEKKGFNRLLIVYEKDGNPNEFAFYQGKWLDVGIRVTGIVWPEGVQKRVPKEAKVVALDAVGRKVKELFCLREPEGDAVVIKASASQMTFEVDGERVGPKLKIKVVTNG